MEELAIIKVIGELGTTVVVSALVLWLVVKEMPAQRKEAHSRFDNMMALEREARLADRNAMVEALKENTASNTHLADQLERVCKHPGTCPRIEEAP